MNIGTPEIVIIFVVALILFGPRKLPEIGRALGSAIRELKKVSREFTDAMRIDVDLDEDQIASNERQNAVEKG